MMDTVLSRSTVLEVSSLLSTVIGVLVLSYTSGLHAGESLASEQGHPPAENNGVEARSSSIDRMSMINTLHEARSAYLAGDTEVLQRLADMHGDALMAGWKGKTRSIERQLSASTIAYLAPVWAPAAEVLWHADIGRRMGFLVCEDLSPWEGLEVCFLPADKHRYALKRLQASKDPEVQIAILRLLSVVVAPPKGTRQLAQRLVTSSDSSDTVRVKALFLLARGSSDLSVRDIALRYLTGRGVSRELRVGAFKALSYMALDQDQLPLRQMRQLVTGHWWIHDEDKWPLYAQMLRVDPENSFVVSEFEHVWSTKSGIQTTIALYVLARYEARPPKLDDWLETLRNQWASETQDLMGIEEKALRFTREIAREELDARRARQLAPVTEEE